jgi:pimeloyl-ACP methyl ester carboxylesterase
MKDGVRLVGNVDGPIDGQSVVLLHGGGQTRHSWRGTGVSLVQLGYRVVAYDARGHGSSDWSPAQDYSLDAYASDLMTVASSLRLQRPVLVGASLGGDTSVVAVGRLGMDVGAIVLVDVVPKAEPAGVARAQSFLRSHSDGFATLNEMAEAIASYQPHRGRSYDLNTLRKNVRRDEKSRLHWHFDPSFADRDLDLELRQEELETALSAVNAPLLLVRGALSDVVSADGVKAFQALRPDAQCVLVDRAAHMVAGDHNDAFTSALIGFLAQSRSVG